MYLCLFTVVSDMLQLCIEMVKSRVGMMQQDYRKAFLTIITALIEKSTVSYFNPLKATPGFICLV